MTERPQSPGLNQPPCVMDSGHSPATIKQPTGKGILLLCAKCALALALGGGAFAAFRS